MIQRHLTTNDADADTPSDQSLASEGAESEDICKGAGHPCSPSVLDEYKDPQDLHQRSASEGTNDRVRCLGVHQLHCELEANANTKMHIHWM